MYITNCYSYEQHRKCHRFFYRSDHFLFDHCFDFGHQQHVLSVECRAIFTPSDPDAKKSSGLKRQTVPAVGDGTVEWVLADPLLSTDQPQPHVSRPAPAVEVLLIFHNSLQGPRHKAGCLEAVLWCKMCCIMHRICYVLRFRPSKGLPFESLSDWERGQMSMCIVVTRMICENAPHKWHTRSAWNCHHAEFYARTDMLTEICLKNHLLMFSLSFENKSLNIPNVQFFFKEMFFSSWLCKL